MIAFQFNVDYFTVLSRDGQIGYARVQKNLVRTPRTSCTRLYAVWNFWLYHSLYGFLSSLITNLIIISRLKRAYTICPSQVGSPWLELRELEIWLKIPSGLHNFQRLISDKNDASISTIRMTHLSFWKFVCSILFDRIVGYVVPAPTIHYL